MNINISAAILLRLVILTESRARANEQQQIFDKKVTKTSKIYPGGTCGPIGLKSVSFFLAYF